MEIESDLDSASLDNDCIMSYNVSPLLGVQVLEFRADSSDNVSSRVVDSPGNVIENLYSLLNFDESFIQLVLPAQVILREIL